MNRKPPSNTASPASSSHVFNAILDESGIEAAAGGDRQDLIEQYLEAPLTEWVNERDQDKELYLELANINSPQTVAEVLRHESPNRQHLTQIRARAKQIITTTAQEIEKEVATALYYLAYAAELIAYSETKTKLPRHELARGIQWTLNRTWVPRSFVSQLRSLASDLQ